MSSFCCENGHLVTLAFDEGMLERACPDCGVAVYKFRDICSPESAPIPDAPSAKPFDHGSWLRRTAKRAGIAAVSAMVLAGVAAWALREQPAKSVAVSKGMVVPASASLATMPAASKAPTPGVAEMKQFSAIATESGVVRVTFQLSSSGGDPADYPSLSVHWPGAEHADTVIANTAYSHPPLPFKTTEVVLELSRPDGATGIEVKLSY